MIIRKRYSRVRKKRRNRSFLSVLIILIVLTGQYFFSHDDIIKDDRFTVTLDRSVDGDTAWFFIDGQSVKVRFLYIDTPESTNQIEPYGQQASLYVAKMLENAKTIELELNPDGDEYDKYDRLLAWVFVDGELLQKKIASEGYCEKFYDYGYDYTYKNEIIQADLQARHDNKGIYSQS